MTTIFLSYARGDDEPFVRRLHEDLTQRGFDVWFDRVSMPARQLTFHQEIRDAVAACDRLLLVVGPKAMTSDYVGQEWRFAYFEADKCVNPIVRLDGTDAVGKPIDGYRLLPEDLQLLHAEDFRDDARYADHLENLVRQLSEDPPRVGKLVAVPELPPHFREQRDRIKNLRDLLLVDLQEPVVVTGAAARVGVQGMGGIGKSVLANALARRPEVRRAFPDGVFWVAIGQDPDLAALQRRLARELGDEALFDNPTQGKETLRKLLEPRAALLILDDVWQRQQAEAFNIIGPCGRLLLTTRDTGLVTALAARENHYEVQLPTLAEAEALLAAAAEVAIAELSGEAREVIAECGRLPLGLALCGGMVAGGTRWADLLEALREHDLEYLSADHPSESQHENIWRAMDVSIRALPEDQRDRFAELAVFALDTGAPEVAVETLWEHTAGLNPRNARKLLADFTRRSLVQRGGDAAADRIVLHDLLHHFAAGVAKKRFGPAAALHTRLLDAYHKRCLDGWPSGPRDGYLLERLRDHLIAAGRSEELVGLLQDLRWLEAKNACGLTFDLLGDYAAAVENLPVDHLQRRILLLLDEALRREIHFIARHAGEYPQGLFQCMWNHGWWYDCPEATQHYEPASLPAVSDAEPKLHRLLECWLDRKQQATPGFSWIRSRRPPLVRLGAAQKAVLQGHRATVSCVTFSPNGRQIASGSCDRTVRVWDAETGAQRAVFCGHEADVDNVAFSVDGQRVVSSSYDDHRSVRLWDIESGAELAAWRGGESSLIAFEFGRGTWRMAEPLDDHTIRIRDFRTGAELAVLRGHEATIHGVSFALEGRRIFSDADDETVRVWDADTGAELGILRGLEGRMDSVSYSPDARWIAIFSTLSMVLILDAENLTELACLLLDNPSSSAQSADSRQFASVSPDATIWVRDQDYSVRLILRGHSLPVLSVVFSPDGRRIASGSTDHTVRVWDADTGTELAVLRGHEAAVHCIAYRADGQRIVTGSRDNTLRVWDAEACPDASSLRGHAYRITSLSYQPDGKRIASGSNDRTVRVWDAETGVELAVLRGHEDSVESVVYSPDGRQIASGSGGTERAIRLWDADTGTEVAVLRGHASPVVGLSYCPDGLRLASASGYDGQTVRVWDVRNGAQLAALCGEEEVRAASVAHAPDGQQIAVGFEEGTLRICDAETLASGAAFRVHDGAVAQVAYCPDGQRIATGSANNTVRLWDVHSRGCLEVIPGLGDVAAIVTGPPQFPWRALSWQEETRIERAEGGPPVARFPVPLDAIAAHPSQPAWAGSPGNHLYLLTLEAGDRTPGPDLASPLIMASRRARRLDGQGDVAGAEPLYWQSIEIAQRELGAEHPWTLTLVEQLAGMLVRKGEHAAAEPWYQRVTEGFARTLGPQHPWTLAAGNALAWLLETTGRAAEARPFRGRCLKYFAAHAPLTMDRQAWELLDLGCYAGAEEMLEHLLDAGYDPANTCATLARSCLMTGRFNEARRHVSTGWAARADAKPYAVARLLWYRLALELLDKTLEEARTGNASSMVGTMKSVLAENDEFMDWSMKPVLDRLRSRFAAQNAALLMILADAMVGRQHLAELDELPEWRNIAPRPLE